MKQVHPNYTFVASTKTITLTGLNIAQDQLLLITNATRGVIYYNFASSSHRAVVTAGANTTVVLTDASTTGHADSDQLVIHYDDQLSTQTIAGTVTANNLSDLYDSANDWHLNRTVPFVEISPNEFQPVGINNNVPISGTVTANVQPQQADDSDPDWKFIPIGFGTADAIGHLDQWRAVSQIAPLPVSASSLPLPSGAATSANQTTTNTSLSNIDTDIGAPADSAASTDTGSFSLISLFKRLLSTKLPDQPSGRIQSPLPPQARQAQPPPPRPTYMQEPMARIFGRSAWIPADVPTSTALPTKAQSPKPPPSPSRQGEPTSRFLPPTPPANIF